MSKTTTLFGFFFCWFAAAALSAQTISTYPYVQDWETEAPCPTASGAACPLLSDWQNEVGTDAIDWTATNQPTPTGTTGPDNDHTSGAGIFLYLESSGNGTGFPNKEALLLSPYFNFTAVASPRLRFWYHVFGFTMGTLSVEARQGSNGTWAQVVAPLTGDIDLWQFSETNLAAFAGMDSIQLRFRGITGTGFYSDMAIDDVAVVSAIAEDLAVVGTSGLPLSDCNLSTYTVGMDIVNNGANTVATGTVIPVRFSDGTLIIHEDLILAADLLSGDTVHYTFSTPLDLSVPGTYPILFWTAYAADLTTGNDTLFAGLVDHAPFVQQFPYYEDFEHGRGGWAAYNTTGGAQYGSWDFGTPSKRTIIGAASGTHAWVTGGLTTAPYSNFDDSWVQSPCFDLSGLCNPQVELSVWWESELDWDGGVLQISTDGGNTWQAVGAAGDPHHWYNSAAISSTPGGQNEGWSGGGAFTADGSEGWVTARHNLAAYAGAAAVQFRVAFSADGVYGDDGLAFDNFHVYDGLDISAGWAGDTLYLCGVDTVVVDAKGDTGDLYLWSDNSTDSTLVITTAGTYTLSLASGICTAYDTFYVVQSAFPVVQLGNGADTLFVCTAYTLDAGNNGATFVWSNGETAGSFVTSLGGNYSVTVTNAAGCASSDSMVLEILLPVYLDLGLDTAICQTHTFVADSGFVYYQWSNGDTSQAINIAQSGNYSLTATSADGCASVDDITVTVLIPSGWSLGADSIICFGDSILLTAGNGFMAYQWSDGSTNPDLTVAGGTYSVTVTAAAGCEVWDTVVVTEDICEGVTAWTTADAALLVYPNPSASGIFYLSGQPTATAARVEIYTTTGQYLMTQHLPAASATDIHTLSLEGYPAGCYWLRRTDGQQVQHIAIYKSLLGN